MAKARRYIAHLDEMLQRTRQAIRRSQELIAKAKELQQQSDQLRNGKRHPQVR